MPKLRLAVNRHSSGSRRNRVTRWLQRGVLGVVAASVVAGGLYLSPIGDAQAAGNAILYMTPNNRTLVRGRTYYVEIWLNARGHPVNTVQANIKFDSRYFELKRITASGTGFPVRAEQGIGRSTAKLARGSYEPRSGRHMVARLHLRAKASSRSSTVGFDSGTVVVRATDQVNVLGFKQGSRFSFRTGRATGGYKLVYSLPAQKRQPGSHAG